MIMNKILISLLIRKHKKAKINNNKTLFENCEATSIQPLIIMKIGKKLI